MSKDREQDIGKRPVKVPGEIPLTITRATEIDLEDPQNVAEWIMAEMMESGRTIRVVVDHETREVKPGTDS